MEFNNLNFILMPEKWKKETIFVTYKILYDVFFIELFFFAISMLAEGVIPGIIIQHIGFSKIIILVSLTLILISYFGNLPEIKKLKSASDLSIGKKTVLFFLIFGALIMFNNQFRLNIFINMLLIAIALIIGYLLFEILREKE